MKALRGTPIISYHSYAKSSSDFPCKAGVFKLIANLPADKPDWRVDEFKIQRNRSIVNGSAPLESGADIHSINQHENTRSETGGVPQRLSFQSQFPHWIIFRLEL